MAATANSSVHERFRFRDRAALEERIGRLGLDIPLADDLSPLFSPLTIGGKSVPNRLVTLPMEGADADPTGAATDLTFRRYRRFARGGCGLIWFEAAAVRPEGRGNPRQLMVSGKTTVSLGRLVDETRRAASEKSGEGRPLLLILQLTHAGRFAKPEGSPAPVIAQHNPVLDGRLRLPPDYPLIADSDLDALQEDYVRAARLAAGAGFDGVDIKACHGYLVSELLAARTRSDSRYGGPLQNRSRFLVETVRKIKSEAPGLLIASRLNLFDAIPWPFGFGADSGGGENEDLTEPGELVGKLALEGVSLVGVTCGIPAFKPHYGRPFDTPVQGDDLPAEHPLVGVARWLRLAAAAHKAAPGLRVVGGGYSWLRQFFPYVAAAMVKSGKSSLIGLGREALAYPDWAADLEAAGALDRRRVCIACSKCSEMLRGGSRVGCAVRDAELYVAEYRKAQETRRAARRFYRKTKED
jgi:2,4-dienoyl-CoA reductase-like NADH-dependent reductase (Old Yellow Enzyme family)